MILVLCALALGYRYYSAFLAAKVAVLDDSRRAAAQNDLSVQIDNVDERRAVDGLTRFLNGYKLVGP